MTSKVIPGLMLLCLALSAWQWYRIRRIPRAERIVYLSILGMCWILALILYLYPNLPSPTTMLDTLFHPLGKLIDK
ncbi:hypothetical protein A8709_31245 [Paenibacillus pectinilyticus]|uniref:Uncharacterized protein n=1 Tax=Paenibacillus pectinilyticus TaxID=512399 RepID=A0A1C0ZW33_9BACL|nr:hypothetical protein [Paenibacillus pectinilyticus]OCT12310.1 hypothetical protein A8709_31245 [Paenibacillus pectinilyticus]